MDTGLGSTPELQAARDRGADCGNHEHGEEDGGAFHSDSEATEPEVSWVRTSRIVFRMELRDMPSVDELTRSNGDPLAVAAARTVLARAREEIQSGVDPGDLAGRLEAELTSARAPALRRVVNATGVIVHTNLGRAPLPDGALKIVARGEKKDEAE